MKDWARYLTIVEGLTFSAIVALFIWRWQIAYPKSWSIFPVWLIASFLIHRDTPKTLGWRGDNLWPATRQGLAFFAAAVASVCLTGLMLGALHHLPEHLIDERRFVGYFAFCLLQQIAVNSYLMNRFLGSVGTPWVSALLASAIFGALHWPNPVLVPVTFLGGFAMCLLFARQRNILPLALGQTILGGLVWWAFPISWHHSMRVGPGYHSFAQRLVTW
jgi:membrane protease YdiL (CAAX protease family)